ncbi:MAG: FtsX-like permease family protein [Christensenellales bacterium]
MKAEFLLTGRYIRKHKKQFFASIACIAVFAASIGAVQLFRLSSDNNTREERFSQEGRLGGYAQDADPSLITDGELEKWDAGAIYITGEAQTDFDTYENTTYVGFMDERAKNLQKLLFKAGDYPKTATEAAVVETTAKALKLGEIGETFTLNITEDGKTAKKKFILAGILREYPLDSWRVMPQVLTGEQGDRNTYLKTNIVYGIDLNKNRDANLFGSQDYNGPTATDEKPSPNEQIVNANMRVTSAVLTAFFLLLVLLGVYTVVKITFQDRERHIGLLRCIGMTKGQAVLSLVMQGIILALCAAVLCAPLGIGFAWVAALVMRLSGYPFFTLVIELQPVLISCAVCAGGVLLAFLLQAITLLRRGVLSYSAQPKPKRARMGAHKQTSFARLWAGRGSGGVQDKLSAVLIAGCVAILLFGTFTAQFSALQLYYWQGQNSQKYGCDYEIYMGKGDSVLPYFFINTPMESGVSAGNIGLLRQTEGLSVDSYAIDDMCTAWILTPGSTPADVLKRYEKKGSYYTKYDDEKEQRENLKYAGYKEGENLLSQKFVGLSFDQVTAASASLQNGAVDRAAYTKGRQVVAFGDGYQEGDRLTVSIPVYKPEDVYGEETAKPVIHNVEVEIAAVCETDDLQTPFMKQMKTRYPDWIAMSDEFLMSLDSSLRYDYTAISYTGDRGNIEAVRAAEDVIQTVVAQSTGVQLMDYLNLSEKWDAAARQIQIPVLVLVGLFLLIIFLALTLSNSVKIKSRLRSYSLLRAIGLDKKQLLKSVFYSTLRICLTGALIGICVGFAASTFIYVTSGHGIPIANVILGGMLPATIGGILLVTLISLLSCLNPCGWVIKQNITESIDSVQY